ncbi:MAG: hypothetical protein NC489_20910 [Ruminococcus flavefaciens]|nr:hypothetical protein [Ruminococcus flavefaciens]
MPVSRKAKPKKRKRQKNPNHGSSGTLSEMLNRFQGLSEKEKYRHMILSTLLPNSATRTMPWLMYTGLIDRIDASYDRLYGGQDLDGEPT